MPEQQHELFDVRGADASIATMQRMRHSVPESVFDEVLLKVVDILAQPLNFPVLRFAQPPHEQMHLRAILWELRRHFLAQKNTRLSRHSEASIQRVAIGEREKIHSTFACLLKKRRRLRIARRQTDTPENPFRSRAAVFRVQVQIRAHISEHSARAPAPGARIFRSELAAGAFDGDDFSGVALDAQRDGAAADRAVLDCGVAALRGVGGAWKYFAAIRALDFDFDDVIHAPI